MHEELGARVEVGCLLWVGENFFEHRGQRFHELGLYFQMNWLNRPKDLGAEVAFTGAEGEIPLIFRWFPVDRLATIPLYPRFLRAALAALPLSTVHVVHSDITTPDASAW